jgi:predicted DNA-binding protein (MmcQ/YjbR family)
MDVEAIREYALAKEQAEEGLPFGESTLVFKVGGKIFLLVSLDAVPLQFNVKCDPTKALEQREAYAFVVPGYHMNKKHWNTVIVDGRAGGRLIRELIDDSYALVQPKKSRSHKR